MRPVVSCSLCPVHVRSNMLAEGHFGGCTEPKKRPLGLGPNGQGLPKACFYNVCSERAVPKLSGPSSWQDCKQRGRRLDLGGRDTSYGA